MSLKSEITKVIKLLDKKKPGWADKINLKKFTINSNTNCILGQLYKGKPERGMEELGVNEDSGCGFVASFNSQEIEEQNEIWIAEITKRQTKKAEKKKVETKKKVSKKVK